MKEQWPDARTESIMLADAALLESEFEPTSTGHDAACHIKAMMTRIRELETANGRYLNAFKAMAYQLLPNRATPEQVAVEVENMIAGLLEEKR